MMYASKLRMSTPMTLSRFAISPENQNIGIPPRLEMKRNVPKTCEASE